MDLKSQIVQLRYNGLGYKRIAMALDVSVNTVKSICQRHCIERYDSKEGCRLCGCTLHHIKGKKKKQFCSDACRMKWWNSHLSRVNKKAYYEHCCVSCHQVFRVYGQPNRQFCSHSCYISYRFRGISNAK